MNTIILDLIIIGISFLFLIGLLAFEYHSIGLQEPILPIPEEFKEFFEFLIWPLVALLIVDLVIKYKKTNNTKKFVKKHWIDIVMLTLIPIFFMFKFLKVGISLVKKLKTAKMGAKIFHKTKNISQKK